MPSPPAHSVLAIIKAARPVFNSQSDKLSFAAHSVIALNGLKLLAIGDQANTDSPDPSSPEVPLDGWNDMSDEHCFLYGFDQPANTAESASVANTLLLKCLTIDGTLLVTLHASGSRQSPETIELDLSRHAVPDGSDATNTAVCLSPGQYGQLQELVDKVQAALESQLSPSSSARGSVAQQGTGLQAGSGATQKQGQDSTRGSELEPRHSSDLRLPARSPLMVDDESPDGWPEIPSRTGPSHGGMAGRGGPMPFGLTGGGMHVGPGHPFFADRLRNPSLAGPGGGMRGPPGLPGGARWDPIAPEGLQGWNPDDFQTGNGVPGRRQGPPVHPDIMPPGPGRGADWDHMFS